METFGKVNDVRAELDIEWQIDDFFSLPDDGKCCFSPNFSFAGEFWNFHIYPNGQSEKNSVGYVGAYLYRKLDGPPITLTWSLAVKTFEGKKYQEKQDAAVFEKATTGWGKPKMWKRSALSEKKSELVPSDVLTLVCHVEYYTKPNDGAGNSVLVKCSHCKKALVPECAPPHEQKCLDKPIRCPTCSDVVTLREWSDHECETARVKATKKLVDDLGDMLKNEEGTDITIRVKHKKFRLHRNILVGRNPYFCSMFRTDMKEKNTGIVSIDDCEPDIFHSFLHFVYTGNLQTLSCENVCALYEVADKYQEDQMKAQCLCFMKSKLSVDNICDFAVLALKHEEKELLQNATDLFCRKIKEILQTVKWQNFMREYTTQANELLMKALDYHVK